MKYTVLIRLRPKTTMNRSWWLRQVGVLVAVFVFGIVVNFPSVVLGAAMETAAKTHLSWSAMRRAVNNPPNEEEGAIGIRTEFYRSDLLPNKAALESGPNSQSQSEEGKPERIKGDGIGKAPVPHGFGFWAIWVAIMFGLCAGEAVLLLYITDRHGQ